MTELFRTVLNMSITGTYIASAIIILRLFMKKLPKKYSYMLWAILGIRLLCPFSFSSAVSVFNFLVPEKTVTQSGQMEYVPWGIEYAEQPQVTVSVPQVNDSINTVLPPAEPVSSVNPIQVYMFIAATVWVTGMAAMVIYTLLSYIAVGKRVRGAVQQNGNIYVCGNIGTPFVFGIIKPKIYLPENVSEEDREYIIAHEQTHIRRKDHIVKIAAMAALCIHWFNPVVWVSYRLTVKDMELSCDEKAVGSFEGDVRKNYANALLNMSVKQNGLSGLLAFGESNVKSRIKGVLSLKKPAIAATAAAVIVLTAAAVCLLTNAAEKSDKFEPVPEGVYVTDKLLYTPPFKNSFWGDHNGIKYTVKDGILTMSNKDAEYIIEYIIPEAEELPFTEEEWDETYDIAEKIGWQDGEIDLGDYNSKYCFPLQDSTGSRDIYLFVMDGELWFVGKGDDIYRLRPFDEYEPNKYYTYPLPSTETETLFEYCINMELPFDAEEEEDHIRFSPNTVMRISPLVMGKADMTGIDKEFADTINSMGKEGTVAEHSPVCREYVINDGMRYLYFVLSRNDDCYSVIVFMTTDDGFTYEKAEKIISTAEIQSYGELTQEAEDYTEYNNTNTETAADSTNEKYRTETVRTELSVPDEGGYNFTDPREYVNSKFTIPAEWEGDGHGLFMLGDKKMMSHYIVYPDTYDIATADFKTDLVSGREIKILDERYGGENDPWSYYIHTAMDSYDGAYDTHHFVVHSYRYYGVFTFEDNGDFDMQAAETILDSVSILPDSAMPAVAIFVEDEDEAAPSAEFTLCADYLTEYINAIFGRGEFSAEKYTDSAEFKDYLADKYAYELKDREGDTLTELTIHRNDVAKGTKPDGTKFTKFLAFGYEVSFKYAGSAEESGYGRTAYFEYEENENGDIRILSAVDFGAYDSMHFGAQEAMGEPLYEIIYNL